MAVDLTRSALHLVGETDVTEIPVDAEYWDRIDERTELHGGRMLMRFAFSQDWTTWEVHPDGEEIVMVISGELHLILDLPDGHKTEVVGPDQAVVVPRGVWHTANVPHSGVAVFITHGRGTEHRPR